MTDRPARYPVPDPTPGPTGSSRFSDSTSRRPSMGPSRTRGLPVARDTGPRYNWFAHRPKKMRTIRAIRPSRVDFAGMIGSDLCCDQTCPH